MMHWKGQIFLQSVGEAIDRSSVTWNFCCFVFLDVDGRESNCWISDSISQYSGIVVASMNFHSGCNVLFSIPYV